MSAQVFHDPATTAINQLPNTCFHIVKPNSSHHMFFFFRFVLYYKRFKISYMIKPVLKILYISPFLSLSLRSRRCLRWTHPSLYFKNLDTLFSTVSFPTTSPAEGYVINVSITNSRLTTDMTRKSAIPRRGNPAGLIPAPPFYYLQTIWTYSDV